MRPLSVGLMPSEFRFELSAIPKDFPIGSHLDPRSFFGIANSRHVRCGRLVAAPIGER